MERRGQLPNVSKGEMEPWHRFLMQLLAAVHVAAHDLVYTSYSDSCRLDSGLNFLVDLTHNPALDLARPTIALNTHEAGQGRRAGLLIQSGSGAVWQLGKGIRNRMDMAIPPGPLACIGLLFCGFCS
jgi:hypothetical protein